MAPDEDRDVSCRMAHSQFRSATFLSSSPPSPPPHSATWTAQTWRLQASRWVEDQEHVRTHARMHCAAHTCTHALSCALTHARTVHARTHAHAAGHLQAPGAAHTPHPLPVSCLCLPVLAAHPGLELHA